MATQTHPLSALSDREITLAAQIIRACHVPNTRIRFKGISFHEPTMVKLQVFRSQKVANGSLPPRKAWVNYYLAGTVSCIMSSSFLISDGKKAFFHEAMVNLTTRDLERHMKVPTGLHGPCDDGEILLAEKIAMEDPRVQAEIKKFQLPQGATVIL